MAIAAKAAAPDRKSRLIGSSPPAPIGIGDDRIRKSTQRQPAKKGNLADSVAIDRLVSRRPGESYSDVILRVAKGEDAARR
jgi:hypothetical protein